LKDKEENENKVLFKVGNIDFTKKYINYLNDVYEKGKSKYKIAAQ